MVIDEFSLFSFFNPLFAALKTNLQGLEKDDSMKKIFQIIFFKNNNQVFELDINTSEVYRRLAESPDATPGERIDLDKRKLTVAPADFEVAPGRV